MAGERKGVERWRGGKRRRGDERCRGSGRRGREEGRGEGRRELQRSHGSAPAETTTCTRKRTENEILSQMHCEPSGSEGIESAVRVRSLCKPRDRISEMRSAAETGRERTSGSRCAGRVDRDPARASVKAMVSVSHEQLEQCEDSPHPSCTSTRRSRVSTTSPMVARGGGAPGPESLTCRGHTTKSPRPLNPFDDEPRHGGG